MLSLTCPPCPFGVVAIPHPDFFYILSSILISIVNRPAINAGYFSDLEIELSPFEAAIRAELRSRFLSADDRESSTILLRFSL